MNQVEGEITEETEAVFKLATILDKYQVTDGLLVANISEVEFESKYLNTLYFKYFNDTPRYYCYLMCFIMFI